MKYTAVYTNARGGSITFSLEKGIVLTDFPLLTGLAVNVETSQSINQVGGAVQSQIIDPRASTIKGFFMGESTAGKQLMLDVIRPMEKGTITVNSQYAISVYVTETPMVEREREFARFEFGVIAPFPFWETVQEISTPVSGILGKFRFPWNLTETYTFGTLLHSYFVNVVNRGQAPTYFDIQITAMGAAKNPVFLNIDTGEFLKLNKTLSIGERVSISIRPDNLDAVSSLDGDIEGLIDIQSTLFSLRSGDNVLRFDADDGRENLTVFIRFTNKYAGVVV